MKLEKYVLALLFFTAFSAHSQTMSGNDLLQKLTDQNIDRNIEGLLYLVGVVDGALASHLVFESDIIKMDEKTKREALISLGKYWGCQPEDASPRSLSDNKLGRLIL